MNTVTTQLHLFLIFLFYQKQNLSKQEQLKGKHVDIVETYRTGNVSEDVVPRDK